MPRTGSAAFAAIERSGPPHLRNVFETVLHCCIEEELASARAFAADGT
jgi:transposase